MKCKNRMINEIVENAAFIMEAHAQQLELIAEQMEAKGDAVRAASCRKDIPAITEAINIMRKLSGCWA